MSLITAMLMLGVITMIHKLGHSLFVKLNGTGVIEFSLGVRSRLLSLEKGGTRYSFKILPFGDFCMMLGEGEGITDGSAFNSKSVWARISVVAAESVFNFTLIFGLPMVLIGIMGYDTTRLVGVVGEYPVRAAGMKADDVIKPISGRKIHPYRDTNWYLFAHPQKSLKVTWERMEEGRGTERFNTELEPVFSTENNQYMIGVQFNPVPSMVENTGQFLVHSAYEAQYWIHYAFDTFYMTFHGMVPVNDISSPTGIVNAIDTTVDETAPYSLSAVVLILIDFTILLSANLGIMNLLSILALDRGRLVSLIAEAVGEKLISKEKESMIHAAGMMVLPALMVLILFNDVRRLF